MLAKKTSKNQITIPKKILSKLPSESDYFDVSVKEDSIVLRPVKVSPAGISFQSIRKKINSLGLSEKDISEAIKWARKSR